MKDRKALALAAGFVTLALTGCPLSEFLVEEETVLGVPTGQRTAIGGPAGSITKSGNDSGGSGGGGGIDIGETGSTPDKVTFEGPLKVAALYPTATSVSVSITQAPRGILALAEPRAKTSTSVSVEWTGQSGFQPFETYRTLASSPLADQTAKELELRRRFVDLPARSFASPGFQVSALAARQLDANPTAVKIDSVSTTRVTVKASDLTGILSNGAYRQKFAILLDDEDADVFSGFDGQQLLSELKAEIQTKIYPKNRLLFGDDPTPTEAGKYAAAGMKLDSDITYLVVSSKVNDAGRTGVLGFFNMADLLANDPYSPATQVSNQAKVIYLSAAHVRAARGNEIGTRDLFATVAHELQHLLFTWARIQAVGIDGRVAENNSLADAWIDEGLAMYASAANGYAPQGAKAGSQMAGHVANFLDDAPDYSLTTFYPKSLSFPAGNPTAAYGMAYLFSQYLVDQHDDDIIPKILSSKSNLLDSSKPVSASNINPTGIVADAVTKDGGNLAVLFGNFAAAIALDGTAALAATSEETQKLYGISGINLRLVRANGPRGVTSITVQPRPMGVAHLKPAGLTTSGSTLKLTGGAGLSSRLLLHQ